MSSKKKKPEEQQPSAAPSAVAQEQPQTTGPETAPETPQAKPEEQQPKEDDAPEGAPVAQGPHAEKVAEVKKALKSFPTLKEGYVTARGVYFDLEIAEQSLEEGEELIIVPSPNKK